MVTKISKKKVSTNFIMEHESPFAFAFVRGREGVGMDGENVSQGASVLVWQELCLANPMFVGNWSEGCVPMLLTSLCGQHLYSFPLKGRKAPEARGLDLVLKFQ